MEKRQRNIVHKRFRDIHQAKTMICLYIPDRYDFMDPALIALLRQAVPPHLPGTDSE